MAFGDQLRLEYSAVGKKQDDALTPLADGDLTKAFRVREGIRPLRIVKGTQRFLDCTNQWLDSLRTTTLLAQFSLTVDVTPQILAWLLSFAFGNAAVSGTDPKTHTLTVLTPSQRELPYTTFRLVYEDGTDVGRKFHTVVLNSIRLSGQRGPGGLLTADCDFLASADYVNGSSSTVAACYSGVPMLFSDCDFLVNSVSKKSLLEIFECAYSNNILQQSDPFVNSVHVQRFRRSAQRPYSMRAALDGVPNASNADYVAAVNSNREGTIYPVSFIAGAVGNRVTIALPSAYWSTQDDEVANVGEAQETAVQYDVEGRVVAGNANSPIGAVAVLPAADQATAFLVAA
jgi:hypothetical protein